MPTSSSKSIDIEEDTVELIDDRQPRTEIDQSHHFRLRELELQTHYQIRSLSDSVENLKGFFDNFKFYVEESINRLNTYISTSISGIREDIRDLTEKQNHINDKVRKRLEWISILMVAQLAGLDLNNIIHFAKVLF